MNVGALKDFFFFNKDAVFDQKISAKIHVKAAKLITTVHSSYKSIDIYATILT